MALNLPCTRDARRCPGTTFPFFFPSLWHSSFPILAGLAATLHASLHADLLVALRPAIAALCAFLSNRGRAATVYIREQAAAPPPVCRRVVREGGDGVRAGEGRRRKERKGRGFVRVENEQGAE